MSDQQTAGAILYAKDIAQVSKFYESVSGLKITASKQDHIVLETEVFQLLVVSVPKEIADQIEIAIPPIRREDTPIKLIFFVASIQSARILAVQFGGELDHPGAEWRLGDTLVCDGHDPEGNVVQFRARLAS
jgi:predicted enzyme related to lactoylglutathione lyase